AAPGVTFPAFPASRADGLAALRDFAGRLSNAYSGLATELEKTASQRGGSEASFVAEARAVVGGLVADAATLDELTRSLERASREATEEAATAERDAKELERKLARRGELEREITALAGRSALLRDLALDLKQDQIID